MSQRCPLHGDLERPLHGSVKVKPGLPWRPQGVGDAKVDLYNLLTVIPCKIKMKKQIIYLQQANGTSYILPFQREYNEEILE